VHPAAWNFVHGLRRLMLEFIWAHGLNGGSTINLQCYVEECIVNCTCILMKGPKRISALFLYSLILNYHLLRECYMIDSRVEVPAATKYIRLQLLGFLNWLPK
jgi:hypothetical protein